MKRVFSWAVILPFFFFVMHSSLYAGAFSGGSGTANDPYLLGSKADFDALADSIDAHDFWSEGKYFVLIRDITEPITRVIGNFISPLGRDTKFLGYFDGRGHVVSLDLRKENYLHLYGLFGFVSDAIIENLGVIGNIAPNDNNSTMKVGSLAACVLNSTVRNCYAYTTCSFASNGNNNYIGGLVGIVNRSEITHCYSASTISKSVNSTDSIGGFVGSVSQATSLTHCYYLNIWARQGQKHNSFGISKSTAEMKSSLFVDLLNAGQDSLIWKVDKDGRNGGFPLLRTASDTTSGEHGSPEEPEDPEEPEEPEEPEDPDNPNFKLLVTALDFDITGIKSIVADGKSCILFEVIGTKFPKGTCLTLKCKDTLPLGQIFLPVAGNNSNKVKNYYTMDWKAASPPFNQIPLEYAYFKFVSPDGFGNSKASERTLVFTLNFPDHTKVTKEIKLIRTPVLFLHGKGDTKERWDAMIKYFSVSGLYKPQAEVSHHLYAHDYRAYNEESFQDNTEKHFVALKAIHALKESLAKQGIMAQSVDLVAHSMGGVLTRAYLQSAQYGNDLHRMITINSPLYGSQGSNIMYSLQGNIAGKKLLEAAKSLNKANYLSPATENLRCNSTATRSYLNGLAAIARQAIIPSFAIASITNQNKSLEDYAGTATGELMRLAVSIACKQQYTRGYTTEETLLMAYGENHDIVVPLRSQLCGMPPQHSKTFFDDWHGGITENPEAMQYVFELLQSSPDDPRWCTTGWKSGTLDMHSDLLSAGDKESYSIVKEQIEPQGEDPSFMMFTEWQRLPSGSRARFELCTSRDITDIKWLISGENLGEKYEKADDLHADSCWITTVERINPPPDSVTYVFYTDIPDNFKGSAYMFLWGVTKNHTILLDTLYLDFTPLNSELTSLRIISDDEVPFAGFFGEEKTFRVLGTFSDGTEIDLTSHPKVQVGIVGQLAVILRPGVLLFRGLGTDSLYASYRGKRVSVPITMCFHDVQVKIFPDAAGEVTTDYRVVNENFMVIYCYANASKGYRFKGWFSNEKFISYQKSLQLPLYKDHCIVAYFEPTTGIEDQQSQLNAFIYPSPANESFLLQFSVTQATPYTIQLYTETGQLLATPLEEVFLSAGRQAIPIYTEHLASGSYYCQISCNGIPIGIIPFVIAR
ncbi:alpha/beta fold hydrolase [bacterium]|nr:alpha/beta fold hydrolase [bacterium]